MNIEFARLTFLLLGSTFLGVFGLYFANGRTQKLFLFSILFGFIWYSGFAASNIIMPIVYLGQYFLNFCSIILGFHFSRVVFKGLSKKVGGKVPEHLARMDKEVVWIILIIVYLTLSAFPLIWPTFRLHQIFVPPPLSFHESFYGKFSIEVNALSKIISYMRTLMIPFFYLALFRLRKRMWIIALILFTLIYIKYVDQSYIDRGTIFFSFVLIFMASWFLYPNRRKIIFFFLLLSTPFMLFLAQWYTYVRLGSTMGEFGFFDTIISLLSSEWSFPLNVGNRLLELNSKLDLSRYFTWILTLPIPKLLTGPIEGARISYEISEIILGKPISSRGWFIVLPGLVAESVFIYGPYFFWFHGLSIGFLAGFFARLLERVPHFLFITIELVFLFGFSLNRGGVASLFPPIINYYLLFYLYLFLIIFPVFPKKNFLPSNNGGSNCLQPRNLKV